MDSFEQREAKIRALKRWAVVRKSVLPTKDEFMNKANRGKKEWLKQSPNLVCLGVQEYTLPTRHVRMQNKGRLFYNDN